VRCGALRPPTDSTSRESRGSAVAGRSRATRVGGSSSRQIGRPDRSPASRFDLTRRGGAHPNLDQRPSRSLPRCVPWPPVWGRDAAATSNLSANLRGHPAWASIVRRKSVERRHRHQFVSVRPDRPDRITIAAGLGDFSISCSRRSSALPVCERLCAIVRRRDAARGRVICVVEVCGSILSVAR